jgi:ABC-type nitrate/sulfonate/bicarbonate transport system substrate-binding protein
MLIARPGIKTITDLKGKRIAVSGLNSVPHLAVREALIQAGMNPDKDVTFLALGGSSERVSALAAGSADASPVDLAYIQKSEQMGFVDLLYLGDAVNIRLGGLGVTQDKIQKNPEQITRMIRATLKGVRFMRPNKAETLAIMRDYLKISGDSVEKIYQYALRSLNEDGLVAKKTVDTEIRIAREQFKIKEDIPESKIFDWRFMKEIQTKK